MGRVIADDDFNKHQIVDNVHFFMCGSVADQEDFIKAYFGVNITNKPDVGAYVYHEDTGRLYRAGYDDDTGKIFKCPVELDKYEAMGSGEQFALAAMDFGKSAKEAVKYAATRDAGTGGKIKTY